MNPGAGGTLPAARIVLHHMGAERVTKEEAIAYGREHGIANKITREADKNHDGFLDRAEVQAYYASREGPPA